MNPRSSLSADRIGDAARYDPQLRTPTHPRLRRGLAIDVQDEQVVVSGIPKRQFLRGAVATRVLPILLPLLDGTRSHRVLAGELSDRLDDHGMTEDAVFKVVSLLWASGVVEEGPPPQPLPAPIEDRVADFLSRMGDSTGANDRWEDAAARALRARIHLVGAQGLVDSVRAATDPVLTLTPTDGPSPPPGPRSSCCSTTAHPGPSPRPPASPRRAGATGSRCCGCGSRRSTPSSDRTLLPGPPPAWTASPPTTPTGPPARPAPTRPPRRSPRHWSRTRSSPW